MFTVYLIKGFGVETLAVAKLSNFFLKIASVGQYLVFNNSLNSLQQKDKVVIGGQDSQHYLRQNYNIFMT